MFLPSKCYFYHCSLCMIKWWIALSLLFKIFFLDKLPLVFAQKVLAIYWPMCLSFVIRLALILQNDPSFLYLIIKKLQLCYGVARPWSYSWSSLRISVLNIFHSQLLYRKLLEIITWYHFSCIIFWEVVDRLISSLATWWGCKYNIKIVNYGMG